jgi:hypothetical protein
MIIDYVSKLYLSVVKGLDAAKSVDFCLEVNPLTESFGNWWAKYLV